MSALADREMPSLREDSRSADGICRVRFTGFILHPVKRSRESQWVSLRRSVMTASASHEKSDRGRPRAHSVTTSMLTDRLG